MKKTLLILSISILNTISFSQTSITNQKTFGGTNMEFSGEAKQLSDGTFVACGSSLSGISGNKTTPNFGSEDGWIINFNADYSVNWELNIGGTSSDLFSSILVTDDGFLCGGSSSSPASGNKTSPNLGGGDFWLFKINNVGVVVWENSYGGSGNDDLNSIIKTGTNEYLLTGRSNSPISGDKSENLRGGKDFWIVKIDGSGNLIWDKTVGGDGYDYPSGTVIADNSIYIVGKSSSSVSFDKSAANFGWDDYWLVKLDLNGNLIWDKTYGGTEQEYPTDLFFSQNKLYIIGSSSSTASGNMTAFTNGYDDFWIVKTDLEGVMLWDKTYGGDLSEYPSSIIELSNSKFLISGSSESTLSGDFIEDTQGGLDYWLFTINDQGDMLEQERIGGGFYDDISNVTELNNSNLLIFGDSDSPTSGDKTIDNYGGRDFWLVEVTTSMTLEIKNNLITSNLTIFPNPNNGEFTISGLEKNSVVSVYNLQGQLISERMVTSESEIKINQSNNLEKGIYLISVKKNNETTSLKYIVN